VADYRALARAKAKKYGLDPNLFARQIGAESGFNPRAVSPAGARGIAQIMPATARGWGVNPDDPDAALDAAAKHMAQYVSQYGNWRDALTAYNAGPGAVGRPLPRETRAYISKITGGQDVRAPARDTATPQPEAQAGGVDKDAAIVDTLLSQRNKIGDGKLGTGLLQAAQQRIATGAYGLPATSTPKATRAAAPASAAPAPHAKGTATFEGKPVAAWIAPILQYARQHGWKGSVNSGVRSFAEQQRIYNSGVRPAAKPGTSNHEATQFPGGAVDVSDAETLSRILRKSPYANQLVWAGAKDPVHFSHPHNGSY
jgi:hypothetical protein